ncbi:glyceraldehyde 3-phosphate dehydrogenase [Methanothermobacter thermautotrophicus str. Delta H]|uniref:Glyceraldehyde-3-phosphate dehydrogenase n=1 Tax=Methanothermobacter thermautotrophicus (strain ATCC 29096 / DSM 1053 / JCM 10044 / NBRC 100330 / Delta H) TaxID=187420 RepID=G3P_METTH|nr:phosphorylating glyceraldehyde-3-phosphate dehydrogenase [Methanothermobacter thermautotrophicus]O27090.1 RecName: Full=Glyceraldehyde-3-phosphate dehydrogenase; Short=GAPDH; AltName: Full=NAD(P)-dependent glyceraldehyde-3-phosphate dehydrogenase [Methanothermobacter thermautotrophicus str. Delta H]AAB85505.1 glyceraldehyde 3-phosphate dehydrogenase [Methanothermobacter thermautotrophicus str. Delta H]WBF05587.1 phosphorylating glyceraldehyde-3-phosphate dehydrogenase [Methanothermobacter the
MISVAINGYGTIGKRVADAVAAQDDMKVAGVSKTKPDFEARVAIEKGYDLYVSIPEREKLFGEAGIPVSGTVEDMLEEADIVVDATPEGIGAKNLEMYREKGIKAIFQGGEKHDAIGLSFNSFANYDESLGADYTRVVSCNTTGLCRTLKPIDDLCGIKKVRAVMVRRGADPVQVKKGPINAIVPNPPTVPSHHGPDLKTVMKGVNIHTVALLVPTTLMHQHNIMVELEDPVEADEIKARLDETTRVMLVRASEGLASTAEIMEYAKELGRSRNDLFEIPVWEESINVVDGELFYMQAVHQESDAVPESVDAIRALLELEEDNMKSIMKTNRAMGIL